MQPVDNLPKYAQLAQLFRDQILTGHLKPGDQLLSFTQAQVQYNVGQGTLDRVYRLLEEDGLIVRSAKQGVFVAEPKRRDRTNIVGMMMAADDFDDNPYSARLLQGIRAEAHRCKVELLLLHKESTVKWEKMDGLIQWPVLRTPAVMPTVTLMNKAPGMASVVTDDYEATKGTVRHLLDLGHSRIGFLTLGLSAGNDEISRSRLQGYRDALAEAGVAANPRWARSLRDPWSGYWRFMDMGYHKMKNWLEEGWRQFGCTAMLAQNDETAIGMMKALHEAGLEVPGDVSVVGFDGLDIAEFVRPSLTTVAIPLQEIGTTAMRLLLRKIEDAANSRLVSHGEEPEMMLQSTLRIGESTAPPGKA